jgi:Tol biopolymer transport system component
LRVAPGTRLGPYEVLAPLGAGGMGEVYRARDTRLGREVAIKVLPEAFSSDPERLSRFQREARSASSLNHPNIVTIHDIGAEGSVSYIAMELVRGEALSARLTHGPMAVRDVLAIGTQIAEGLSAVHALGIVHRDLKPGNVMVTPDDQVKILDFGLAKVTEPQGAGPAAPPGTTLSRATEPGLVMGTVGYMSPEQVLGQPVDFRSDQFALGAILYEMATGREAFRRVSAPDTLSAILHDEPEPIEAINARAPLPLRWIVERCLTKEPRRRYASTEDLARDLTTVRDRLSETTSAPAAVGGSVARSRRRSRGLAAAGAVVLLAIGLTGWRLVRSDATWENPLANARFTRLTDWEGSEIDAAISRDGKLVAFLSDRDGSLDVFVTQVGSGEFLNVSRGHFTPLYIEELRTIGFVDDSHLWVRTAAGTPAHPSEVAMLLVPTLGGSPRPFPVPNVAEVDWSPDRTRTAYHPAAPGDPFFVADRSGLNPHEICGEKPGVHEHYPRWSPDGRYVYFVRGIPAAFDMDVWRVPSTGGTPERLTDLHSRVSYPAFLDERTLLFAAKRSDSEPSVLYAMDVGQRVPHPMSFGLEEYLSIDASGDGRRLVATVARPDRNLWTVPISDQVVGESAAQRFRTPSVRATAPRFGPDFIVYLSSRGGPNGLWKLKDGVETELWSGSDGAVSDTAAVSPDGGLVAFVAAVGGRARLYVIGSDGTNPRQLAGTLDIRGAPSWSPDGKWIAVVAGEGGEGQPLFRVPVDGGQPERLVRGVAYSPAWSPDGRFIVYAEGHQGRTLQLKAVTPDRHPFAVPALTVSRNEILFRFTPDGKALVVMRGEHRDQNFSRLDLATGTMTRLTEFKPGSETRGFDVSPDGREILFDRYRDNADIVLIDLPRR